MRRHARASADFYERYSPVEQDQALESDIINRPAAASPIGLLRTLFLRLRTLFLSGLSDIVALCSRGIMLFKYQAPAPDDMIIGGYRTFDGRRQGLWHL